MTNTIVSSGATSTGITLNAGDSETVQSGGIAANTRINSGGVAILGAGAVASGGTIQAGGVLFAGTGVLSGTFTDTGLIEGGATLAQGTIDIYVSSGGVVSATQLSSAGTIHVGAGGIVSGASEFGHTYSGI